MGQTGERLTIHTRNGGGEDGRQDVYATGSRYALYNKRELLTAPGEWFHDTQTGKLFLKPVGGSLAGKVVEAKRRDFGFDLTDRSFITVQGLSLFTCYPHDRQRRGRRRCRLRCRRLGPLPVASGFMGRPSPRHRRRRLGRQVRQPLHRRLGPLLLPEWPPTTGLVIAGSDNVVRNCRIQYSAATASPCQGLRHKCLNNLILDTDYSAVDCAAISTGTSAMTRDAEIAYNTIDRTGRSGLTLRTLENSDGRNLVTRIHHNDVANFMIQVGMAAHSAIVWGEWEVRSD